MATHILLVEDAQGDTVGIKFPSVEAARDWEDAHELDITAIGCVRIVSPREALKPR